MKKSLAALGSLAVLAVFGLSACGVPAKTTVSEGDGPATSQTTEPDTTAAGDTTNSTTDEGAAEGAGEEPAEPAPADFHQKYTYDDGVQVEVIKVQHSKVTRYDAEIIDDKDEA